MKIQPPSRGYWLGARAPALLAIIVCLTALTRFYNIGALSLWFDEGYTAWLINHPASQIIHLVKADTAPPLYYLLLHGWAVVFGNSEAALRSFSAVLSCALVPLVYGIARRLVGYPAALLSAALVAGSYMQQWYGREARAYELGSLLAASMVYALVRACGGRARGWMATYVAAAIAAVYTSNLMPLYVLSIGAGWLVLGNCRWKPWMAAHAVIAVAYIPWLITLRSQVHRIDAGFWIERPTPAILSQTISGLIGVRHFWSWDRYVAPLFRHPDISIPYSATIAFLVLIAAVLYRAPRSTRRKFIWLLSVALLPVALSFVISRVSTPIFLDKALLPSTPFIAILLAMPVALFRGRHSRTWATSFAIAVVLLLSVNTLAFVHEQTKENWRAAARYARQLPPADRLMIFIAPEAQLPFDYYYHPASSQLETGAPTGFFDDDPPVALKRVRFDADLNALKVQLLQSRWEEVLLIDSHAGWVDRDGASHPGFADTDSRTVGYLIANLDLLERIDLPDDRDHHDITIYRFAPASRQRFFYARR